MPGLEGARLGAYELLARIGGGAQAEVYRARQLSAPGREVAIKAFRPGFAENQDFHLHFLREAQAISQLAHPNILPVIDFGEEDQILYLVMPLIRGTLRDLLRQYEGMLPLEEVIPLFTQLCSAVDAAHTQGIIHRNLKPQNIFLRQGEQVLLSDFAIAPDAARMVGNGPDISTVEYMAPEEATGQPDARSDIYSLGVILYQLLTGSVPFSGTTPRQVMMQHINEPPPDPRPRHPGLPPRILRTLRAALEKDPDRRLQSAQSLGRAVQAWQEEQAPFQAPRSAERLIGSEYGAFSKPPAGMDGLGAYGNPSGLYGSPASGFNHYNSPPTERFSPFSPSGAPYPPPNTAPFQPGFGAPSTPFGAPPQGFGGPPFAPGYLPPGFPGQIEEPAPEKRHNAFAITFLSIVTLLVVVGAGLLVAGVNGKGPFAKPGSQTSLPTTTPGVPAGYSVFTNSTKTFQIAYPSSWQATNTTQDLGSGGTFQTAYKVFLVTDAGAGSVDPAQLDTVFCQGKDGKSGFGGSPSAPKQVTLGDQNWTEEECDNATNQAYAAVETIIYHGHVYLISYASPKAAFSSDRGQYYSLIEQTFKFLT